MNNASNRSVVTAVTHAHSGVTTAFFNELPGLVVQGKTEEEVSKKLQLILDAYIKRLEAMSGNFEIHAQTIA